MCFAAGCVLACYKNNISAIFCGIAAKIITAVCGVLSYIFILYDGQFIFGLQLISFVLLSFFIVMAWEWLAGPNPVLKWFGNYSLDCYLMHIGVVECIYSLKLNVNLKTVLFVTIVSVGILICYNISEKCYKSLSSRS